MEAEVGSVIQIIDLGHHWYPCLLVVTEVRHWGVLADCLIPDADGTKITPILLENRVYKVIGPAAIVS